MAGLIRGLGQPWSRWGDDEMATSVGVGVVSAAEINQPVNGGPPVKLFDMEAPFSWATLWVVVAFLFLWHVL